MPTWLITSELTVLFFLHGMALSMWFVPLSRVLDAHGLHTIKPFAFATSAVAGLDPLRRAAALRVHLHHRAERRRIRARTLGSPHVTGCGLDR